MKVDYNRIVLDGVEASCISLTARQIEKFMNNAKRANKAIINRLVKRDLPDVYHNLALEAYNPYNYYKTKRHIILVHSSIEYFISYSNRF